jgi:hypothetical protein
MSYTDTVIHTGSLSFLETWPPIYRGHERTVLDRLKASQIYAYVYFRYTPCLTDFTFEFIRRPTPPILSPSSKIFVKLTLVTCGGGLAAALAGASWGGLVAAPCAVVQRPTSHGGRRKWKRDEKHMSNWLMDEPVDKLSFQIICRHYTNDAKNIYINQLSVS